MRQLQLVKHVEHEHAALPRRPPRRPPGSGTISGAGSTFAAPVYEQWASAQSGLTVNYQAVGSGAGITALESKIVDFGASDPPLKPADEEAIAKNGSPAVQIPMFLGRDHRLLQPPRRASRPEARRQDARRHLPRQDQDLERRRDQGAEPRRDAAEHRDHGHPPLGLLRARPPASPASWPRSTPNSRARSAKARTCSGRPARAPRATPASPARSSRRSARSATSSRRTRCRTTSPTPRSRTSPAAFVAPDARLDHRGGAGREGPGEPRHQGQQPAGRGRYPITSQTFIVVNKDLCKAGHPRRRRSRQGRREVPRTTASAKASRSSPRPTTRRCRPRSWRSPRKRSRACSATARRSAAEQ